MKKRFIILCTLWSMAFVVRSQDYKFVYYMDAEFNSVAKAKALVIGRGLKENGLFRLDCYAVYGNYFLLTAHFKDSSLSTLEGVYSSYHLNGKKEKLGNYIDGYEEGKWEQWDSTGSKTDSTIYKNGLAYVQVEFRHHKNGVLSYYSVKDSLADTYKVTSYNEQGVVDGETLFNGQKGVIKRYTSTGIKTDSVFTREEIEASFPGGDAGWRQFLTRNLDGRVPVDNKAPAGTYTVMVKFIVNADGSLDEIEAETHIGYGTEAEVIRLIKKSPNWIPALQYGRKVRAYRRQPVTFLVEEQ